MSTRKEDMQFYEWLFGRRSTPIIKDNKAIVPYPLGYKPIKVDYRPSEDKIEVKYDPSRR